MKKDIHANNYRYVIFQDLNNSANYFIKSTIETKETIKIDNQTYPLVKVHISSSSHPFYTGEERVLDIEGRVDKFKAKKEAARNMNFNQWICLIIYFDNFFCFYS